MPDSTHCPTCAAPIREESSRFCAFCGTKLPEPPKVVVQAWAPNAAERFAAAERHPSVPELLKRAPSTAPRTVGEVFGIVFLTLFCVIALGLVTGILGVGAVGCHELDLPGIGLGAGLFALIPILIASVGIAAFVLHLRRVARFQSADLVRTIAFVVDKRTQSSGDLTTNHATLETKDRERREYEIDARCAGRVVLHDLGMAYVKGDVLLDFQRIDVG